MKDLEPMMVIRAAESRKALANMLGIGVSSISQWRNKVPMQRVWQLQVMRPTWFSEDGSLLPSAKERPFVQEDEAFLRIIWKESGDGHE